MSVTGPPMSSSAVRAPSASWTYRDDSEVVLGADSDGVDGWHASRVVLDHLLNHKAHVVVQRDPGTSFRIRARSLPDGR